MKQQQQYNNSANSINKCMETKMHGKKLIIKYRKVGGRGDRVRKITEILKRKKKGKRKRNGNFFKDKERTKRRRGK